jgi:hypothetical protein
LKATGKKKAVESEVMNAPLSDALIVGGAKATETNNVSTK